MAYRLVHKTHTCTLADKPCRTCFMHAELNVSLRAMRIPASVDAVIWSCIKQLFTSPEPEWKHEKPDHTFERLAHQTDRSLSNTFYRCCLPVKLCITHSVAAVGSMLENARESSLSSSRQTQFFFLGVFWFLKGLKNKKTQLIKL